MRTLPTPELTSYMKSPPLLALLVSEVGTDKFGIIQAMEETDKFLNTACFAFRQKSDLEFLLRGWIKDLKDKYT